jgi:hypothetical protein
MSLNPIFFLCGNDHNFLGVVIDDRHSNTRIVVCTHTWTEGTNDFRQCSYTLPNKKISFSPNDDQHLGHLQNAIEKIYCAS